MPITEPGPDGITSVHITFLPHKLQRYDTCGDYLYDRDSGELEIRVSQTADWRESVVVAIHELVEASLVVQKGIPIELIDMFDQAFEGDSDEPGENPAAPYYDQHVTATVVERLMAHEIGLHWDEYEDHIYALSDTYPPHGREPLPSDEPDRRPSG